MSNPKVREVKRKTVHVEIPEVVWNLVTEIAKRYRVPKTDALSLIVMSEARRLGIEIKTLDK